MASAETQQSTTGVNIGQHAPDFSLPSQTGDIVRLYDLLAKGTVVLFFYPKDNSVGCTAEACAFRDTYAVFKEAGAEVIGISTDSTSSHQHFVNQHNLPFILLSDVEGKVRKLYGATAMFGLMTGRITFVIDREGTVRHSFNSMIGATQHVGEALNIVQQLSQ